MTKTSTNAQSSENNVEKARLLENGLPTDWLVRARCVSNFDTMVHLADLQEKWAHENMQLIASMLNEHEENGFGFLSSNDPPRLTKDPRHALDPPKVCKFINRLMELIRQESVIWDRINNKECGQHRQMRQAWCNISLKLGGWATVQHVHLLKSIYRRKRDQYNNDHLRQRKPFQYAESMSFLKNVLETYQLAVAGNEEVEIANYMTTNFPELEYFQELDGAPKDVQDVMLNGQFLMEEVSKKYGDEALAEFMTNVCNDAMVLREELAEMGLRDVEWTHPKVRAQRSVVVDDSEQSTSS